MNTEQYFKNDAKQIIDTLFDGKLFIDTLTRDDLNSLEDWVCFAMNSKFNSIQRAKDLFEKIKSTKLNP